MRTAIVIPGSANAGRCRRLVAEAEALAEQLSPRAVIFSGWSRGRSEAEQMRDAWRGPPVELVVEPTARITAENASRTLPLLLARGIDHAVVVCAPLHLSRARFFFRRLYGSHGIDTAFRAARIMPSLHALAWELLAFAVRRPQLRAAEAEVARLRATG